MDSKTALNPNPVTTTRHIRAIDRGETFEVYMPSLLKTIWGAIILTVTFLWIGIVPAYATNTHNFACADCHRASLPSPKKITTFCITCHSPGGGTAGGQPITAVDTFMVGDASNARGRNVAAVDKNSHYWGGAPSNDPAAGSQSPPTSFYKSSYSISTGLVTCTICHDPHQDTTVAPFKLLRASTTDDLLCKQCHAPFYQDNASALLTHPVGPTVKLTADPTKYNSSVVNTANGNVRLISGTLGTDYVSCTSCHGTHFTDSNSATLDNGVSAGTGDNYLLRTDGKSIDKSRLCQACHVYKEHGKMSDGGESVGCLVCHSAHVYNNGAAPNYFVLRNNVTTATFGAKTISYLAPTTAWNDNTAGTTNGYCEKCHGSAETIQKGLSYHGVAEYCRTCHSHNGSTYSFQTNAAACGDCHGFPPYLNQRGDTTPGGYAYTSATHNYLLDANHKDESLTAHSTHAAGGTAQGSATDYNWGTGATACDPCHLNLYDAASHHTATDPGSYRDLAWSPLAKAQGLLSPSYATSGGNAWKCSSTYCHSNGGKRTSDAAKVAGDYVTAVSPVWRVASWSGRPANAIRVTAIPLPIW